LPLFAPCPAIGLLRPGRKDGEVVGEEGVEEKMLTEDRVGVFSTLTNSYALVAVGASENFYRYVLAFQPSARVFGRRKKYGKGWRMKRRSIRGTG
jgi:hypothetical protein